MKFLAPGIIRSQCVSGPGEQLPGAQDLSPHCRVDLLVQESSTELGTQKINEPNKCKKNDYCKEENNQLILRENKNDNVDQTG